MTATLYHVPRTISSPIVQCLLELDVVETAAFTADSRSNRVVVQEMTFPELKSETYLRINPMGTSPGFQDGDVTLWESGAVLDYLLQLHDREHKLHPRAPPPVMPGNCPSVEQQQQRANYAKYLQIKQYIIATVYPAVASLFLHTLKPLTEQVPEIVQAGKDQFTNLFGPILTRFLGDGPFFLGTQVSAVDFLVAKPLNNAHSLGLLNEKTFPELYALWNRVRNRDSFVGAYEGLSAIVAPPPPPPATKKTKYGASSPVSTLEHPARKRIVSQGE